MKKSFKFCVFFLFVLNFFIYSENSTNFNSSSAAFIQGTEAYKNGDWISSITLLKKALTFPENNNADTQYMLISAQMHALDYMNAYSQIEDFIQKYPQSIYTPQILFYKGKVLFNLAEYEKSILILSDFCHQYPENSLYPVALFYIGENFYSSYNYEQAKSIFERLVTDFPDCSKTPTAQFRLDSINQRTREEKLLYLLKETGEEYLSAKEDYERQMRTYGSETSEDVRRRMADLQKKNADLEMQNKNLSAEKNSLQNQINESQNQALYEKESNQVEEQNLSVIDERVLELKKKAQKIQKQLKMNEEQGAK